MFVWYLRGRKGNTAGFTRQTSGGVPEKFDCMCTSVDWSWSYLSLLTFKDKNLLVWRAWPDICRSCSSVVGQLFFLFGLQMWRRWPLVVWERIWWPQRVHVYQQSATIWSNRHQTAEQHLNSRSSLDLFRCTIEQKVFFLLQTRGILICSSSE